MAVLQEAEREIILQALKNFNGNVSRAASQLGLPQATLYQKMKKSGPCVQVINRGAAYAALLTCQRPTAA